ncbi:MAG: hypothetical protein PUC50_04925 [Bacteroidales bacterium]|nr:hypothetical protein [Bacteroidales bacterium]
MEISVDSIWATAQFLTPDEKIDLSKRLLESASQTEEERRKRAEEKIDRFFGGWSGDGRTPDEVMAQIRGARTNNTYPSI